MDSENFSCQKKIFALKELISIEQTHKKNDEIDFRIAQRISYGHHYG